MKDFEEIGLVEAFGTEYVVGRANGVISIWTPGTDPVDTLIYVCDLSEQPYLFGFEGGEEFRQFLNLARTENCNSQEVDEGYARAVELEPWQLWYQQRWVRWMLSRGRRMEAREAWLQALHQTNDPSEMDEPSLYYYRNLHWLVAERALDTGALDFAGMVLDDIPQKIFSLDDSIKACQVKFEVLKLAETHRLVRPLSLALARGTSTLLAQPELLPQRIAEGDLDNRWYAARVEGLEQDRLHLLIAIPPGTQGGEVRYQRTVMMREVYDSLTQDECFQELTPGRYLEIGEYGPDRKGLIQVFRLDA